MPKHFEKKIVNFTADQMYQLVADIDNYCEFLPWCNDSKIIEVTNIDNMNKTSIYISHGTDDDVIPFKDSYETNMILDENNIDYEYKSFKQGHGVNNNNLECFIGWLNDKY